MRYPIVLLATLALLNGCIGALMEGSRTPETATFTVPFTQGRAYQRAVSTAIGMGATITLAQSPSLVQGVVQNAALLSVRLTPVQEGTLVHVSASILPNKIVLGAFTTTQDFQRAYEKEVL
jgi:hypothetical protein